MKRFLIVAVALTLSACGQLGSMLSASAGPPPQLPAQVTTISRTAIAFALNSFDAALYGLDFAMDSGRLVPGSEPARRIAAAGRRVMNFLGAAEAARDLGSSATYEEAFGNAKTALDEFRSLFPTRTSLTLDGRPPLTPERRSAIIARLEGWSGGGITPIAR